SLAAHVSRVLLSTWTRESACVGRTRHVALGHQREGSWSACLRAARRTDERSHRMLLNRLPGQRQPEGNSPCLCGGGISCFPDIGCRPRRRPLQFPTDGGKNGA